MYEIIDFNESILSSDKLLKLKLPEIKFIVEQLIPSQAITFLSGQPGVGKSWIMMEIARTIASNKELFGKFKTQETKTLYIDEESPPQEIQRRWKMLTPAPITMVDFLSLAGVKLDSFKSRQALLEFVKANNYKMVIFDSFRDLHNKDENNSRDAQLLMDVFKEFTKLGITLLVSHHHRKISFMSPTDANQILRGSSAILAGIDSLLSIELIKQSDEGLQLAITQSKLRQGKSIGTFKLNIIETDGKMTLDYDGEIESEMRKIGQVKEIIKEMLTEREMFAAEIVKLLIPRFFSERTIKRAIKELKEDEEIQPRKGEGNRTYYSVNKDSSAKSNANGTTAAHNEKSSSAKYNY